MTRAHPLSPMSAFDDFLYASVGEENGMRVSVLSVLARLDLDPWREAEQLAHSTGAVATRRLSALITELPNGPTACKNPAKIAAELIVLLPQHVGSTLITGGPSRNTDASLRRKALLYAVLFNAMFMAIAIGGQYIGESWQQHQRARIAPVAASGISQPPPPHGGGR